MCVLFSSWSSKLTWNILHIVMAEAEDDKNWGLQLAHHPFFLILVAKASQMTKNWCWEGPTELYGEWHRHREEWRIGIIIGNISEKKYGGSNEGREGRKLFSETLTIGKSLSQVPLWSPWPASTSASPALRSAPFPGADYSDWRTGSSFWYLKPFCFLSLILVLTCRFSVQQPFT